MDFNWMTFLALTLGTGGAQWIYPNRVVQVIAGILAVVTCIMILVELT